MAIFTQHNQAEENLDCYEALLMCFIQNGASNHTIKLLHSHRETILQHATEEHIKLAKLFIENPQAAVKWLESSPPRPYS